MGKSLTERLAKHAAAASGVNAPNPVTRVFLPKDHPKKKKK